MRVRKIYFGKAADVPNSTLPMFYCTALFCYPTANKAKIFRERFRGWLERHLDRHDLRLHNFHSNAHEVLGIAEGRVTLRLGGEEGSLFRLKAGDMLLLPAGIGHRRVGADDGLKVIGAYPRGQSNYDMKRHGRTIPG